jgi:hypothetical protein
MTAARHGARRCGEGVLGDGGDGPDGVEGEDLGRVLAVAAAEAVAAEFAVTAF